MKEARSRLQSFALVSTGFALATVVWFGCAMVSTREAPSPQDEVSPTKAREREFYVPNTEDLKPDEMRVVACGTGMPTTRAAQAAACFLVELGNGDKFLFDIGSGLGGADLVPCRSPTTTWTRSSSVTCTPTTFGSPCTTCSSAAP